RHRFSPASSVMAFFRSNSAHGNEKKLGDPDTLTIPPMCKCREWSLCHPSDLSPLGSRHSVYLRTGGQIGGQIHDVGIFSRYRLRTWPLIERKAALKKLLRRKRSPILYLDHVSTVTVGCCSSKSSGWI